MTNSSRFGALKYLKKSLKKNHKATVFFLNAHNFNLAMKDDYYLRILRSANVIFPDGIGIRIALRKFNIAMRENLAGTDIVPLFLRYTSGKAYLIGSKSKNINLVADYFKENYCNWKLVGFHHGYLNKTDSKNICLDINRQNPDLILLGMGTPIQEKWIIEHFDCINFSLCLGVGGLFDYWSGNLYRAPKFVRGLNLEWLWILFFQPYKWNRYIIGGIIFILRLLFLKETKYSCKDENK